MSLSASAIAAAPSSPTLLPSMLKERSSFLSFSAVAIAIAPALSMLFAKWPSCSSAAAAPSLPSSTRFMRALSVIACATATAPLVSTLHS